MPFQLPMPCKNISDCFPCNDLPTTNKSSEAPDVIQDFVLYWGNPQTNQPPLGDPFSANGCGVVCASSISFEDAFLCAQRSQYACIVNNRRPTPQDDPVCLNFPCPGVPPVPDIPQPIFFNEPESCLTHCQDGTPFLFTVPAGSFAADNQVLANRMASSFACRQAAIHKLCLNMLTPFVCQDQETSLLFAVTGSGLSASSNFWELRSGTLPPGFSFSSAASGPSLAIPGTPTTTGDFTFTIRVTAPNGDFTERPFTVTVDAITTTDPLPDATVNTAYSETLLSTIIDGSWVVIDGELPDGLTLASDGTLSGTPTEDGDFTFTVQVGDEDTACNKEFTLTVAVGCFIDASPNLDLTGPAAQAIAINGGLGIFTDGVTGLGWYYLDHTFAQNPLAIAGTQVQNLFPANDRYILGTNLAPDTKVYWIDLVANIIRDLGDFSTFPNSMNDNGDFTISDGFSLSFIYSAASNTFSANLFTADTYTLLQINNSGVTMGMRPVAGDQHLFRRSAAGVYTDLHPVPPVAGQTSFSNAGVTNYIRGINSAGHIVGVFNAGVNDRVFANFGGASVFLAANQPAGSVTALLINDNDQVMWKNNSTGHIFIWDGGITTDLGAVGFALPTGWNDDGVAVISGGATAQIYSGGVISTLISKIPSAVGDGWTSLDSVFGISNDNFVWGFGTKGGVSTPFVAKVCV